MPQDGIDRTRCLVLSRNTCISPSRHAKDGGVPPHRSPWCRVTLRLRAPRSVIRCRERRITPFATGPGAALTFQRGKPMDLQNIRQRISAHSRCVHITQTLYRERSVVSVVGRLRFSAQRRDVSDPAGHVDGVTSKGVRDTGPGSLSGDALLLNGLAPATSAPGVARSPYGPSCSPSSFQVTYVRVHFLGGRKSEFFTRASRHRRRARCSGDERASGCARDIPGGRHDPPSVLPRHVSPVQMSPRRFRARAPVYDELAQHPNCRQLSSVERARDCPPPTGGSRMCRGSSGGTRVYRGRSTETRVIGERVVRREVGRAAKMGFDGKIRRDR